jgi:hypothetical protein
MWPMLTTRLKQLLRTYLGRLVSSVDHASSVEMANTLYGEVSPEKRPDPTLGSLDTHS